MAQANACFGFMIRREKFLVGLMLFIFLVVVLLRLLVCCMFKLSVLVPQQALGWK